MKSSKSFLEFYKTVLEKVNFDQQLFWKEYHKAMKYLNESEAKSLMLWVSNKRKTLI